MQLHLNEADVKEAVEKYITNQKINRQIHEIIFTMGRKGTGVSASVNFEDSKPGTSIPKTVNFTLHEEELEEDEEDTPDQDIFST